MTEPAEVRVRLVVDDQSAGTLEKVKAGLQDTGDEAKVTNELLKGIGLNIEHIAAHQVQAAAHQGNLAEEVAKGNVYFAVMKASVDLVGEGIKQAWERV